MFKPMSDIEVEKMMIELEEEDNLAQKLYQEMDSDVKNELIEYTLEILNELYSQNINLLHDEGYDDFINSNVKEMVKVQISCIQEYNDPFDGMDENIKVIIPEFIISDAERVFYTHVAPRRSYDTTFIRIKPNISQIENKIEPLQQIKSGISYYPIRTIEDSKLNFSQMSILDIKRLFRAVGKRYQLPYLVLNKGTSKKVSFKELTASDSCFSGTPNIIYRLKDFNLGISCVDGLVILKLEDNSDIDCFHKYMRLT